MGRISLSDIDNYGGQGNSNFFQLKDDGDKANVRFLYNTIDDVQPYVVHEIEVEPDKRRYVNCLRSYNEPVEKCPLCAAGYKAIPKLFLKLFNEDANECQIWERGKAYASRISNLASHYNPLVDEIVEISRSGKKGDKQTRYEFYPVENSPTNLDDYECTEPLGTIILDKDEQELDEFVQTGSFSTSSDEVAKSRTEQRGDSGVQRRTPSNSQPARRAF